MSGSLARPSLDLARAAYREISLYAPDRAHCRIDLSDNTNLLGVPPAAERALRCAPSEAVTRYPSLYADKLKSALARYACVEPQEVVTGCGSDDVLDSAIRAFSEPGDRIAFPDPSFAMIPIFARMNGLEPIPVPLTADYDFDVRALLATNARIVYLCSPNNPTATRAGRAAIERVIAEARGLVILDQAYAEFDGPDFVADVSSHPRLIVTRTLSKAFGLAGLRIGYATGRADLMVEIEKSRGPYKVSVLAELAAVAALAEDGEWVRERIREVVENRERFAAALRGLGLAPLPSTANFVLVPVTDATAVGTRMRGNGIAVRPFVGLRGIGDALRITIGPWTMMEECLGALAQVLR